MDATQALLQHGQGHWIAIGAPPQVSEPGGFGAAGHGAARGRQPGLEEGAHLRVDSRHLQPTPVARQWRSYVPARPYFKPVSEMILNHNIGSP